jgi:hypothetical protein
MKKSDKIVLNIVWFLNGFLLCFLICFMYYAPHLIKLETKVQAEQSIEVYNSNYNSMILYMMYSEGLVQNPEKCPAGQLTVGFGHQVRKNENLSNLNYREAFELLQVDYCKRLEEAENLGYDGNRKLAVAHLLFSTRRESVDKILKNMNSILHYDGYYRYGEFHASDNIRKGRVLEKDLFFSNEVIDIYKYL